MGFDKSKTYAWLISAKKKIIRMIVSILFCSYICIANYKFEQI